MSELQRAIGWALESSCWGGLQRTFGVGPAEEGFIFDVFAPFGGFLVECPNIEKACVCPFVCLSVRILTDFYRMAYAPASNADAIRFIFRGVQKVSQKNRPLRKTGAIFRVPFFFELFLDFCVILGTRTALRVRSLQRGRTALRVQSSRVMPLGWTYSIVPAQFHGGARI